MRAVQFSSGDNAVRWRVNKVHWTQKMGRKKLADKSANGFHRTILCPFGVFLPVAIAAFPDFIGSSCQIRNRNFVLHVGKLRVGAQIANQSNQRNNEV